MTAACVFVRAAGPGRLGNVCGEHDRIRLVDNVAVPTELAAKTQAHG